MARTFDRPGKAVPIFNLFHGDTTLGPVSETPVMMGMLVFDLKTEQFVVATEDAKADVACLHVGKDLFSTAQLKNVRSKLSLVLEGPVCPTEFSYVNGRCLAKLNNGNSRESAADLCREKTSEAVGSLLNKRGAVSFRVVLERREA